MDIAVTPYDFYPWFVPAKSTFLSHFCCAVSMPLNTVKKPSLVYYTDLNISDLFRAGTETYFEHASRIIRLEFEKYIAENADKASSTVNSKVGNTHGSRKGLFDLSEPRQLVKNLHFYNSIGVKPRFTNMLDLKGFISSFLDLNTKNVMLLNI
ncbi:hypothetical protein AX774_g3450 [Zancudomyces culisetae]|uniref:Uncharacterized protein n=1 Tax=Zancudomyces culisetae TaxID=1213189 RepID=A0A1R1PCA3_ZANCU|nr:hypothetical protein AX774_g8003 [Zancudomyces culisetae]OMH83049.1 hypothetical protein AX774_g3450 [Zancudomyces culisetae]|eukprot:OMH78598.1 hypothetical protein AX774_g8003 [Zancudomyces culisetae]